MISERSFIAVLALFLLSTAGAGAATSDWHEEEGAALRLVTEEKPRDGGRLRGVLEIRLEPGWKTYWRDPGDAGIPPSIDVSESANVASAAFHYPVPERFDDGYSVWAGYDEPVSLGITFEIPDPAADTRVEADIFLGICREICIPLTARLSLDPRSEETGTADAAVEAVFDRLPRAEREDFHAEFESRQGDALIVDARVPDGETVRDLFMAGTEIYALGKPERLENGKGVRFSVPLTVWDEEAAIEPAFYTLVTDKGAVSGRIDIAY